MIGDDHSGLYRVVCHRDGVLVSLGAIGVELYRAQLTVDTWPAKRDHPAGLGTSASWVALRLRPEPSAAPLRAAWPTRLASVAGVPGGTVTVTWVLCWMSW